MQGEPTENTERFADLRRLPAFLLRLDKSDISLLLADKSVSCTIPGELNGKPIELSVHGAKPPFLSPQWFQAQVYGKTPFYMFVPTASEKQLRNYLLREAFEIRTSYLGTFPSAYAKFEIKSH
jgi:hypothetical protein